MSCASFSSKDVCENNDCCHWVEPFKEGVPQCKTKSSCNAYVSNYQPDDNSVVNFGQGDPSVIDIANSSP